MPDFHHAPPHTSDRGVFFRPLPTFKKPIILVRNAPVILNDYERFELNAANGKAQRVVWAPFNRNTYVQHGQHWHFAGLGADRDAAKALAQDKQQQLTPQPLFIRLKHWLAQIFC